MKKILTIACYCLVFNSINAQEKTDIIKQLNKDWLAQVKFDNGYMNINIALQMWNVESLKYPQGDFAPRYDMFIRRGRFGVNGKIASKLTYGTTFSYDGIGKDVFTVSHFQNVSFNFLYRDLGERFKILAVFCYKF